MKLLKSKNNKLLKDFIKYCKKHQTERFWQALRNWAKVNFIFVSENEQYENYSDLKDTFYWERKNG